MYNVGDDCTTLIQDNFLFLLLCLGDKEVFYFFLSGGLEDVMQNALYILL